LRSFEEITRIVKDLQMQQGPVLTRMKDILDRYDGDWVLPMPDIDKEPNLPPLTPALVADAVDNMAMRAASVKPVNIFPAIDPNKDRGRRSREYAEKRRKIVAATYHSSKWNLARRRYYRQLAAYHTCSLVVLPDFVTGLPKIEVRDPLGTYVEPQANEELRQPEYVAFVTRHSAEYLRRIYPQARQENGGPIHKDDYRELWDCVEWYDLDQTVFGIIGPVWDDRRMSNERPWITPWQQLSPSYPNRIGQSPAVVPHNVSLGRIASRIGSMLGSVDLQARLMALDILAQEKAIWPDMYAIGRAGGMPRIIGGTWKDGREGDINLLQDVESIGQIRSTPDIRTSQVIDRLERNFRTSTGLLPQFGGETYGALRTGRGIDALTGMALDPRIQELHEISEAWLPHLNAVILETYKAYWPDKKFSMYSGWPGDKGIVEFTPKEHIETTDNTVSYNLPGADVIQQTQILGSLRGAKAISGRTFRAMHPYIDDPEAEEKLVQDEDFDEALRQSILQKLLTGEMPLVVSALIKKYVADGLDIFDAVVKADEEVRARQASQAPEPPPGMAASPEAMPGMAAPPQQMMAMQSGPTPETQGPQAPRERVAQLLQALSAGGANAQG
jgi:hypothetical protein